MEFAYSKVKRWFTVCILARSLIAVGVVLAVSTQSAETIRLAAIAPLAISAFLVARQLSIIGTGSRSIGFANHDAWYGQDMTRAFHAFIFAVAGLLLVTYIDPIFAWIGAILLCVDPILAIFFFRRHYTRRYGSDYTFCPATMRKISTTADTVLRSELSANLSLDDDMVFHPGIPM